MQDSNITLQQAVPYIRLYKGKTFVVKVGGRILQRRELIDSLISDVSILQSVGIRVVFVHGGGPQATELAKKLGLETKMVAGRRVTDAPTLEVAKMVYGGALNIDLLASFRAHETPAVGLSGVDGGFIAAHRRPLKMMEPAPGEKPVEVDFGFVGDIETVHTGLLEHLLSGGFTPVISSLASDAEGTVFNVNADSVAEAVARALKAEKLIVATDTDGILRDVTKPMSQISYTDLEEIAALKASGALSGGMLPKVDACVSALKGGVRRTHIINGMKPSALLQEVFTNAGCGTMIVERREREAYQSSELKGAAA